MSYFINSPFIMSDLANLKKLFAKVIEDGIENFVLKCFGSISVLRILISEFVNPSSENNV